jgi:hypothetical protein
MRRSDRAWKNVFDEAGLKLVNEQVQEGLPAGLYVVKMCVPPTIARSGFVLTTSQVRASMKIFRDQKVYTCTPSLSVSKRWRARARGCVVVCSSQRLSGTRFDEVTTSLREVKYMLLLLNLFDGDGALPAPGPGISGVLRRPASSMMSI